MKKYPGFSLIELLVAGGLFVVFAATFVGILLQTLSQHRQQSDLAIATAYAIEGLEMVKAIRKDGFTNLETLADGGVEVLEDGSLRLHDGPDTMDKFQRVITVEYGQRDDGSLVDSGSQDEKTFKVTATVVWESVVGFQDSITYSGYMVYWDEPF